MDLLTRAKATQVIDVWAALLAMLVAFLCSHVIALVYLRSHGSLSDSQSFVQALVMASVGSSMMMLAIGYLGRLSMGFRNYFDALLRFT